MMLYDICRLKRTHSCIVQMTCGNTYEVCQVSHLWGQFGLPPNASEGGAMGSTASHAEGGECTERLGESVLTLRGNTTG